MGLKKTSTTRNATQDAYTPGWAADDQLTSSKVSEDFAKRANISTNVQPAEVTNNLGLRPTGKAVAGSTYGDYKGIGGRNAGGGSFDNTTQDYEGTTSSSLHRQVQVRRGERAQEKGRSEARRSEAKQAQEKGRRDEAKQRRNEAAKQRSEREKERTRRSKRKRREEGWGAQEEDDGEASAREGTKRGERKRRDEAKQAR
jgi:hypothetical protein